MEDITKATSQQIQERLYHMAKETIAILERHNVPYSLAYGTLLGAVRHHGFIPWDEDFDLWLFDDSYKEALSYLRKELPADLFLEDEISEEKYFHSWAHVKDLYSEAVHSRYLHDDSYKHKGLHIDLYRLKKVKSSELWNYLNQENRSYIMRRKALGFMSDEEYNRRMSELADNERKNHNNDEQQQDVYALINSYKCKSIPVKYFFSLKKYTFEDSKFYGVNEADSVLTEIYGDYMTPTPEAERDGGHLYVILK